MPRWHRGLTRREVLAATGGSVGGLAGCLGRATPVPSAGTGPPTAAVPRPVPYALETLREAVISGGVPRDGIPAIDDPSFIPRDEADEWLADGDVVFGVRQGNVVKAYPQRVLVYHEIVNDRLGDRPVAVTYCPLTGTAIGFDRGATTFGVTGDLVNNNLIAYDRATESRWPQVLATAIDGPYRGRSLREVRVVWTSWGRWKRAYPDTAVLSRDTGYARNYARDPYGSYNPKRGHYAKNEGDREQPSLFPVLHVDGRHHMKKVVIGARTVDGAIAVVKDDLRRRGLAMATVGETPYLAAYDPVLETGYLYRNPADEGYATGADGIRGPEGTVYPPDGLDLPGVNAFDAMWFAWVGFYPRTTVA